MVYYDSAFAYIDSGIDIPAKIAKINTIITALEDNVLKAVGQANIEEYSINDGQTIIKTTYRDVQSVIDAIRNLETIRQMWINRCNGRVVRLVDGKNFYYRNGNR